MLYEVITLSCLFRGEHGQLRRPTLAESYAILPHRAFAALRLPVWQAHGSAELP